MAGGRWNPGGLLLVLFLSVFFSLSSCAALVRREQCGGRLPSWKPPALDARASGKPSSKSESLFFHPDLSAALLKEARENPGEENRATRTARVDTHTKSRKVQERTGARTPGGPDWRGVQTPSDFLRPFTHRWRRTAAQAFPTQKDFLPEKFSFFSSVSSLLRCQSVPRANGGEGVASQISGARLGGEVPAFYRDAGDRRRSLSDRFPPFRPEEREHKQDGTRLTTPLFLFRPWQVVQNRDSRRHLVFENHAKPFLTPPYRHEGGTTLSGFHSLFSLSSPVSASFSWPVPASGLSIYELGNGRNADVCRHSRRCAETDVEAPGSWCASFVLSQKNRSSLSRRTGNLASSALCASSRFQSSQWTPASRRDSRRTAGTQPHVQRPLRRRSQAKDGLVGLRERSTDTALLRGGKTPNPAVAKKRRTLSGGERKNGESLISSPARRRSSDAPKEKQERRKTDNSSQSGRLTRGPLSDPEEGEEEDDEEGCEEDFEQQGEAEEHGSEESDLFGDAESLLSGDSLTPDEAKERAHILENLEAGRRQMEKEGKSLRDFGNPEKDETDRQAWLRPAPWSTSAGDKGDKARRFEPEDEDEVDSNQDEGDLLYDVRQAERTPDKELTRDTEEETGSSGVAFRLSTPHRSSQKLVRREGRVPCVCLLGRPNVGKSSLFNTLKDKEDAAADAIVRDEDGTTRDRHYAFSVWRGRPFIVVDTGGLIFEEDRYAAALYAEEIRTQVKCALEEATCAIFVVDGRHGLDGEDEVIAHFLRRSKTPVVVCVNKTENVRSGIASAQDFWKLGLGQPFPCSAVEGVGLPDLLDACFLHFPADSEAPSRGAGGKEKVKVDEKGDARAGLSGAGLSGRSTAVSLSSFALPTLAREDVNVAIVGRPNVGKSQLLNRLLGVSRSLVSPQAGTTRDAVDELVQRDGRLYRLVDTAGIRRARVVKAQKGVEFVMVKRAERALARCDVCLLVCDAERGLVKQDILLAKKIEEEGRAAVIVMNKWDTVDAEATAHHEVSTYIRSVFYPLRWASIVCVSALTGKNASRIWAAVNDAFDQHRRRLGTGLLNFVLRDALAVHPPPLFKGRKRGKIYVAQQVSIQPPTIVVFCNKTEYFPEVYRLYLDFSTRTAFNFHFTPIKWLFREKKRRKFEKVTRSKPS
ncbi:putative GTP-binding protein engA [Toxoplasma gondii FOU]|uniref:GTPase Der n=1 Tax=Toxoplasma gondii FOU TaxID=943167 RepID=A0A086K237_TOXGO|nr:putative GTP-binding protein engA [Toxoplasma gondii FOU]